MAEIVLTDDQMKVVRESKTHVRVCDPNGICMGTVNPEITPEFIAEMKRRARSPGPWYTGEQVQNHLKALEVAWEKEGPFDEKRMREILEEARAADRK